MTQMIMIFKVIWQKLNLVDGSVLAPSSFAETDAITGQWIPKKYVGSYGTNGFYLNFSDNSGTTATTLGKDYSGNGNNFTPNNFSVAAGVGNDSLEDSPTNNFSTLNQLSLTGTGRNISNGNLDYKSDSNYSIAAGNFSLKTGKWYWEVTITAAMSGSNGQINGIVRGTNPNSNSYVSYDTNGNVFGIGYVYNGSIQGTSPDGSTNSPGTASGLATFTNNDVLGFATDIPNGTLAFYKNGSLQTTITGLNSHDWFPAVSGYGTSSTCSLNFGQRPFAHTPPTGHKALCSANLPDPTIKLPNKHFDILLWDGNGTKDRNITGLNFSPDWVWIKSRSHSVYSGNLKYNHVVWDTLRGVGLDTAASSSRKELTINENYPEGSAINLSNYYGHVSAFNSDGFTLDHITGQPAFLTNMASGRTYVGWNWNAGDTDGKTYTVKVVSDSGNKYRFDDFGTSAVTIRLAKGGTYIFDQSDSSNAGHPLRFSATSNGTHGGGTEYTTGVTTAGTPGQAGAYTQIVVDASAPVLYYYCTQHSGMGGQVDTNTDLGSSNFDGSIQAVVKANPTAGFSIVIYSGNGTTNSTIGHGLGVAPKAVIVKRRNSTDNFQVYWIGAGTERNGYITLNNALNTPAQESIWGTGVPTSTKFYLGTDTATNTSGSTYVGYVFSEVAGFSKFGEYTGNGNSNGPFVYTGFRPAYVIIKGAIAIDWVVDDTTRSPFNESNATLFTNLSDAEYTGGAYGIDFLSNGFKPYNTYSQYNQSGTTYIYFAFAESPFKNARAR